MTFTEIATEIKDRLGYTSTAANTRVGRLINKIYREVGTSIGMSFTRQTAATEVVTIGQANVTFSETEKILQVWILDGSSNPVILGEVLLAELRGAIIPSSDKPTAWALVSTTSNGVTIRLNAAPGTAYTLYADVIAEVSDLSGSSEPTFPESFHDILIEGVLRDEYRKLEKVALARDSANEFQRRLSDLRMFVAKSSYMDIQQGKLSERPTGRSGGGTASQAVIGPASSTDNAIVRFNGTGGTIIQDSGITIADGASGTLAGSNSGDVTLAGTPDYITVAGQVITRAQIDLTADVTGELPTANIAAAAVTYAKIQDISATSRVLGRKTALAGDTEECTLSEVLDFVGSAVQGDILYRGVATWTRLGAGTSGYYLQTQGAGANPQWAVVGASAVDATGTPANNQVAIFTDANTVEGDAAITWDGTQLVLGDATAEDISIKFDGNAQDYHIGLDDSADELVLGLGSVLGTTPAVRINSSLACILGGDIYNTAWTDYATTSTVVGWSSFTVKVLQYKKVGKLVFVQYRFIGTSNATTANFTLPFAAPNITQAQWHWFGVSSDNGGALIAATSSMATGGSTVDVWASGTSGAWTGSGTKTCAGSFWYETV